MTRKLATFVLAGALAFAGCKKLQHLGKKDAAASPAAGAAHSGAPTAPPPPPDLASSSAPEPVASAPTAPASPTSPSAPATPTSANPPVDRNASAIAICYHNIEDNSKMKALTISVAEFEREMKAIKDNGFTVIPLQDFLAWRRGEKSIPTKSCIITIDDGWVSGYTNAWPILKKYGYPFTLFIYINYVGTGGKSLSWDQLEELRDAGVDIQCHTYSHSNLHGKGVNLAKGVPQEIATMGYEGWLKKEIIDSRHVLEEHLGIKVNALAYPYGIYNSKVREVVKTAGYDAAFTVYGQRLTHSSPSDLLGRYAVEAGKPKIFEEAMAMVGGGVTQAEAGPAVAQLAAASMVTEPADGAVINNPTPKLKANLATMGDIDQHSIQVRMSGVGVLPTQFDPATKLLTVQITQKLKPGSYRVIVAANENGQRKETGWSFKFDPTAKPSSPADAPLPPQNPTGH